MYATPLKLQLLLIEASAAATKVASETYLRFLEQQASLLRQVSSHGRAVDGDRDILSNPVAKKRSGPKRSGHKIVSPCCGADLNDHYGRRNIDVDVERI